jgi:glycosyltransferase involved in cell wall biosynthesis
MRLSVTPRMSQNYDLRRADLMVIPSGGVTADFESWPDRARRVRVVYNGVDLEEFRRSRSRGEARRTIGVPNGGPLLAVLGQLGPRKGGDVILKAFAAVAPDFPGAKLMFVGNSHRGQEAFGEQLKATAAARPELMDRVFFFPYTRHILPYYEAADLNLLISRDEGFGRTIIEAGAMGTPSIGTRVGGIPEVIDPGKTGLIVEPDDPDALAAALRTMLSDPEKMKSLGEAAFRHVAHDFSIKRHAEEMMDLYDGVVENSRSPH